MQSHCFLQFFRLLTAEDSVNTRTICLLNQTSIIAPFAASSYWLWPEVFTPSFLRSCSHCFMLLTRLNSILFLVHNAQWHTTLNNEFFFMTLCYEIPWSVWLVIRRLPVLRNIHSGLFLLIEVYLIYNIILLHVYDLVM